MAISLFPITSETTPSWNTGFSRLLSKPEYPHLRHGLIGAWMPCLGPTGGFVYDVGFYARNATLTNMDPATDWVPSTVGYALDFDGTNDHLVITHQSILSQLTGASWVWWMRLAADPGNGVGIMEKTNASDFDDGWFIFSLTGLVVRLTLRDDNADGNWDSPSNFLVADNRFHQYVITWNGAASNGVAMYRDGAAVTVSQADIGGIGSPNDGSITIAHGPLFSNYLTSAWASILFYNRPLMLGEVTLLARDMFALVRQQALQHVWFKSVSAPVTPSLRTLMLMGVGR